MEKFRIEKFKNNNKFAAIKSWLGSGPQQNFSNKNLPASKFLHKNVSTIKLWEKNLEYRQLNNC